MGNKSETTWWERVFWAIATAGVVYVILIVSLPGADAAVHIGGAAGAGVVGAFVGPVLLELIGAA